MTRKEFLAALAALPIIRAGEFNQPDDTAIKVDPENNFSMYIGAVLTTTISGKVVQFFTDQSPILEVEKPRIITNAAGWILETPPLSAQLHLANLYADGRVTDLMWAGIRYSFPLSRIIEVKFTINDYIYYCKCYLNKYTVRYDEKIISSATLDIDGGVVHCN